MATRTPIHDLQAALEAARLGAIETLASRGGLPSDGDLHKLADLQTALTAVKEEIAAHEGHIGWGAAKPLE